MGQFKRLGSVTLKLLVIVLSPIFLGLFLLLFLGPAADVIYGTIDLVRMTGSTTGTIKSVDVIRGKRGTSRPVISYQFETGGMTIESQRLFPGWAGNHLSWSGGGATARMYAPGSQVNVIYIPSAPERAAIERGWFGGSVGFMFAIWGMIWVGVLDQWRLLRAAAAGAAFYGFGLLIAGPAVVRISQLHLHILTWLVFMVLSFVWNFRTKKRE